jgi:hypothetical protein
LDTDYNVPEKDKETERKNEDKEHGESGRRKNKKR